MSTDLEQVLATVAAGTVEPVYLVAGDLVVAEPAAQRLGEALAQKAGCQVVLHRRPSSFVPILEDLRTYSLFSPAKVVLAVDTAILAERSAAADLVDEVAAAPAVSDGDAPLSPALRQAASRLLQALRLFQIDPYAGAPEEVIGELPVQVLQGGSGRRRGKAQVEELRARLVGLLEAARANELQGWGESDLVDLAAVIQNGLPPGHSLVLVERSVAEELPVVETLQERGVLVRVARVESQRGGWQGLEEVGRELARQTGVEISPDALQELARRTLRSESRGWRRSRDADADSTARLAAEYKKLATVAEGGEIDTRLVEQVVQDRGEEDVWGVLDALGRGQAGETLARLERFLAGAEDPLAARLAFFSLLASFCRQLTTVRGLMRLSAVPPAEKSYGRFKSRWAPKLQAELPGGEPNPVAGLHPYRLHRVYLAAGRLPEEVLHTLPWRVLETELRLKGQSGEPAAALTELLVDLSASLAGPPPARS